MKESDALNIVSLVALAMYLAELAGRGQTCNDLRLLEAPNLVPFGPWNRRELLDRMLTAIQNLDADQGRPLRTGVVRKTGGDLPSPSDYRQRKAPLNGDKMAVIEQDRSVAQAYYRSEVLCAESFIDAELVFDSREQFVAERYPRRRPFDVAQSICDQ